LPSLAGHTTFWMGLKFSVSLAFIGWIEYFLHGNKIFRFSCLYWLDIWLFGLRLKFPLYLAFIGWTDESLDLELKSPSISPSLAGRHLLSLKQPLDSESNCLKISPLLVELVTPPETEISYSSCLHWLDVWYFLGLVARNKLANSYSLKSQLLKLKILIWPSMAGLMPSSWHYESSVINLANAICMIIPLSWQWKRGGEGANRRAWLSRSTCFNSSLFSDHELTSAVSLQERTFFHFPNLKPVNLLVFFSLSYQLALLQLLRSISSTTHLQLSTIRFNKIISNLNIKTASW
jgi:hypothetical protein